MSVRTTMSSLIARTRLMVADTAGASQLFADQDIQDTLDEVREDVRYEALEPRPSLTPGGILYTDYYGLRNFWEADETLIDLSYSSITPLTSDEIVGHWTFTNQYPPVLITGKRYDLYRAAATLLDLKIANLAATAIDFTADGQSFHLSQQLAFLEKRRDSYLAKAWPQTIQAMRTDMEDGGELGISNPERQRQIAGPVSANVPFLTGQ